MYRSVTGIDRPGGEPILSMFAAVRVALCERYRKVTPAYQKELGSESDACLPMSKLFFSYCKVAFSARVRRVSSQLFLLQQYCSTATCTPLLRRAVLGGGWLCSACAR